MDSGQASVEPTRAAPGSPPAAPLSRLPHGAACAQKVRWAVGIAGFNAGSFGVCAVGSAVLLAGAVIFGEFTVAAEGITLILFVIAYFEFRGRRLLKELQPAGCILLGWNQLGLMAALWVYCIWSIYGGFASPPPKELAEHPDWRLLESELGDALWPAIVASIYGGVIIATLMYQGGNAWYYFTRRKFVEQCRALAGAGVEDVSNRGPYKTRAQ